MVAEGAEVVIEEEGAVLKGQAVAVVLCVEVLLVREQLALAAGDGDAVSGQCGIRQAGEPPSADGLVEREVDVQAPRDARAYQKVATEAEGCHGGEDRFDAAVIGMVGATGIDIDEQVVGELAEAFAEDEMSSVVGLDGFEREGDFLAAVVDGGFPAMLVEHDG